MRLKRPTSLTILGELIVFILFVLLFIVGTSSWGEKPSHGDNHSQQAANPVAYVEIHMRQ